MFSTERLANCSLIVFPERLKTKEGYLLGINLTEFVVVVLDVIDPDLESVNARDLKRLTDFPGFKEVVGQLITVEYVDQDRNKGSGHG